MLFRGNFCIMVLDFFKFSHKKCDQVFLRNTESCIKRSGYSSSCFSIRQRMQTMLHIFFYIFIFCAESLGFDIRRHNDIKGIKFRDTIIEVSGMLMILY